MEIEKSGTPELKKNGSIIREEDDKEIAYIRQTTENNSMSEGKEVNPSRKAN